MRFENARKTERVRAVVYTRATMALTERTGGGVGGLSTTGARRDRELVPAQTWEPGGGGPSVCCECIRTATAAGCARTAGQHVPTVIAGR